MCASVGDLSHAHFRPGTELNHLLGQWQTIILLLASLEKQMEKGAREYDMGLVYVKHKPWLMVHTA